MTDKSELRFDPNQFPLTRMIANLYSASPERRRNADPEKTAAHYGVPVATAAWWIGEARRCPDVWPMRSKANAKRK